MPPLGSVPGVSTSQTQLIAQGRARLGGGSKTVGTPSTELYSALGGQIVQSRGMTSQGASGPSLAARVAQRLGIPLAASNAPAELVQAPGKNRTPGVGRPGNPDSQLVGTRFDVLEGEDTDPFFSV